VFLEIGKKRKIGYEISRFLVAGPANDTPTLVYVPSTPSSPISTTLTAASPLLACLSTMSMRGLTLFISDLRALRSRDQELPRINRELANIRTKFKDGNITGYDRKKYVAKLMYIYILGYQVDVGLMEAVHLLGSNKYSEKQIVRSR